MYQVTIKGETIANLRKNVAELNEELNGSVEKVSESFKSELSIAPSFPAQEVTTISSNQEVDSEGNVWNESIHSSSKEKTAKGVWRAKRGIGKVNTEVVATPVIAEVSVTPVQVVATPVIALPTMNSGHTKETFVKNFPLVFGNLISEGKINQQYVETLKNYFQVGQIWEITDDQKGSLFESFVESKIIQKAE